MLARQLLAYGSVREIQTVVGRDNPASLRILARLGQVRSDCGSGAREMVVQVSFARRLTDDERRQVAEPITRTDTQADQLDRPSQVWLPATARLSPCPRRHPGDA